MPLIYRLTGNIMDCEYNDLPLRGNEGRKRDFFKKKREREKLAIEKCAHPFRIEGLDSNTSVHGTQNKFRSALQNAFIIYPIVLTEEVVFYH